MQNIGGKQIVGKATKIRKKKSTTSKRHFTVVIGNNEHGLYVSSSPSSAARKAVSKLCATDKKKKVQFSIREITQGSKKKTYGPYLGEIEKLAKPIELKGRIIRYKPVAKLNKKTGKKTVIKKMKGGLIKCVEIIFEGDITDIQKITDYWISNSLFDFDVVLNTLEEKEIRREENKLIIVLRNLSDENLAKLYSRKFRDNALYMFTENDSEIEDKNNFKINIKKYLSTNNEIIDELIRYTRLAFCHYGKIGHRIMESIVVDSSCSNILDKFFDTGDHYERKSKCFRNQQPDFKNFKDKELYYVFEGFTTLKNDELIKKLRELNICLEKIRESHDFKRTWKTMWKTSTHNSNNEYNTNNENASRFLNVFSEIIERWGELKPKIIDIEGNILLEV
jgi:hypothetical protein